MALPLPNKSIWQRKSQVRVFKVMARNKIQFTNEEYYHIFNRGTDKREVISDNYDLKRFLQSLDEFNTVEPIGSIYENSFIDDKIKKEKKKYKLVNFVAYCVNPNHYHLILEQLIDGGISKFTQRFGSGYTQYYNQKYQRSGVLFQGPFKAVHIDSNEYLLHLSAYVNLNDKVHQLGSSRAKLSKSSWGEYTGESLENFCGKSVILDQFKNKQEYKEFVEDSLKDILERKERDKEFKSLLLE